MIRTYHVHFEFLVEKEGTQETRTFLDNGLKAPSMIRAFNKSYEKALRYSELNGWSIVICTFSGVILWDS